MLSHPGRPRLVTQGVLENCALDVVGDSVVRAGASHQLALVVFSHDSRRHGVLNESDFCRGARRRCRRLPVQGRKKGKNRRRDARRETNHPGLPDADHDCTRATTARDSTGGIVESDWLRFRFADVGGADIGMLMPRCVGYRTRYGAFCGERVTPACRNDLWQSVIILGAGPEASRSRPSIPLGLPRATLRAGSTEPATLSSMPFRKSRG